MKKSIFIFLLILIASVFLYSPSNESNEFSTLGCDNPLSTQNQNQKQFCYPQSTQGIISELLNLIKVPAVYNYDDNNVSGNLSSITLERKF